MSEDKVGSANISFTYLYHRRKVVAAAGVMFMRQFALEVAVAKLKVLFPQFTDDELYDACDVFTLVYETATEFHEKLSR